MKRRVLAVLGLAVLLLAVPTVAQAKGASAATISGGGSGGLPKGPITLKGDGEPGSGSDLANLAEAAGVVAVLFEDGPGGALAAAPTEPRGPRYTITWTFPNGDGGENKVRQHLWPYAAGGPVTYLPPGQPVFDSQTKGGWYRGDDSLRLDLIALGLPKRQPLAAPTPAPTLATPAPATPAPATPAPAVWPKVAAGVGLLLAVAVGGALLLRRRSRPGAATAR